MVVRLFGAVLIGAPGAWGLFLDPPLLEDLSSLVQGSLRHTRVAARGAGVEDAWEALLGNDLYEAPSNLPVSLIGWPRLGDAWDEVKEATQNLSSKLGDLSADVEQNVPNPMNDIGPAVRAVAAGLSIGLQTICKEMDWVWNETLKDNEEVAKRFSGTQLPPLRQLLGQFEAMMGKVLGSAYARWSDAQDAVDRAVTSLSSGLEAGGQRRIAQTLQHNMRIAQGQASLWLKALSTVRHDVQESGQIDVTQVEERMSLIQDDLHQAMQSLSNYLVLFQQAFLDLIDTISSNLPVSEDVNVNYIFSIVHQEVDRVAWRTKSAAQGLRTGVLTGLRSVAAAANVTLPEWTPVYIPLLSGSEHTSVASRGLLLLVALAFAIAHH